MMVNRATEVHLYSVHHVASSLQLIITQIRKKKKDGAQNAQCCDAHLKQSFFFFYYYYLQPSVTSLFAIFNPSPFLYLFIHVVASIETASRSISACLTPEVLVLEARVWRLTLIWNKTLPQGVQSLSELPSMLSSSLPQFGPQPARRQLSWATHPGCRWSLALQQQTCSYRVSPRLVVLLPELQLATWAFCMGTKVKQSCITIASGVRNEPSQPD